MKYFIKYSAIIGITLSAITIFILKNTEIHIDEPKVVILRDVERLEEKEVKDEMPSQEDQQKLARVLESAERIKEIEKTLQGLKAYIKEEKVDPAGVVNSVTAPPSLRD